MATRIITAEAIVTGRAPSTGAEVLRPGWIEVTDGRITAISAGRPPRPTDDDLGAVTLIPGFVDMHSHGGGGSAFTEATPEAVDTVTALHGSHGTTAMMASLVSASPEELLRQVRALAEEVRAGRILGIHLEGPWMSPCRIGAHEPSMLRHPDPAEIDALLEAGDGAIRMVTLAPELPGGLEAVRRLVDAGVIVAVGHTEATYDETRAAIDAGASVATHLFNAMRPIHHREPGPVVALCEDPRVTVELIGDGVHVHPVNYRAASSIVGPDRLVLMTDAMAAAGMTDGPYMLGSLAVDVTDGIARVAGTDTIAGSTACMDQLFRFAVDHCGLTGDDALLTAVRQTSLNPARVLGLPHEGLVVGAAADLVALDADLNVVQVIGGMRATTPLR